MKEIEFRGSNYNPIDLLENAVDPIQPTGKMKINQSPRLRQVGGENVVNIQYVNNILWNNQSKPLPPTFDPGIKPMEAENLLALIDSFPHPRYRHFIEFIRRLAINKFNGNKTHAAKWLGMSHRRLTPSYKTLLIERATGNDD